MLLAVPPLGEYTYLRLLALDRSVAHRSFHCIRRGLRRSNAIRYNRKSSAAPVPHTNQLPANPVCLDVVVLESLCGTRSPLDELVSRLNDAGTVYGSAYPQDALALNHYPQSRAEYRRTIRYCAGHDDDDVPAIPAVDFRYCNPTSKDFASLLGYRDDGDLECAQVANHSQTDTILQRPRERDTPVSENYDLQELATSKYSFTIEPDPEDDVMHRRRAKPVRHVAGALILAGFTKKLISRLRKKLSRTL